MARKSKARSAGKRDTVRTKRATFYAKRTARGRFREMDEKGRARKTVRSGYGDQGDHRARRRAA